MLNIQESMARKAVMAVAYEEYAVGLDPSVISSAYNSAKRLGGYVKVDRPDSETPSLYLSSASKNSTRAWVELNLFCGNEKRKVIAAFNALGRMGLPYSAVDGKLLNMKVSSDSIFS